MATDILREAGRVGLHGVAIFEKDDPYLIGWQYAEESPSILYHRTYPSMQIGRIDRHFSRQALKLLRGESTVSDDLGQHLLRCRSGKPANRCIDHRAKRQDGLVNRQEVDDIARDSSVGSGACLVGGKVDGMKDKAEGFVGLRWKETEVCIGDPFQNRAVIVACDDRTSAASSFIIEPGDNEPGLAKMRDIRFCNLDNVRVPVVEYIDVLGSPRPLTIERRTARDITFGAALACQQLQERRLEGAKRHGRAARCVRRDAARSACHGF